MAAAFRDSYQRLPEAQAELPRLRPNDESCSWLAAALKAHIELEDVEAEKGP